MQHLSNYAIPSFSDFLINNFKQISKFRTWLILHGRELVRNEEEFNHLLRVVDKDVIGIGSDGLYKISYSFTAEVNPITLILNSTYKISLSLLNLLILFYFSADHYHNYVLHYHLAIQERLGHFKFNRYVKICALQLKLQQHSFGK